MEWNEWFCRFFDCRHVGYKENFIEGSFIFSPIIFRADYPLTKFAFEVRKELFTLNKSQEKISHISLNQQFDSPAVLFEVSVTKTKQEPEPKEIFLFELNCRSELKGKEIKEIAEFDHFHKARNFIDYPMGFFAVCKKMIYQFPE